MSVAVETFVLYDVDLDDITRVEYRKYAMGLCHCMDNTVLCDKYIYIVWRSNSLPST